MRVREQDAERDIRDRRGKGLADISDPSSRCFAGSCERQDSYLTRKRPPNWEAVILGDHGPALGA